MWIAFALTLAALAAPPHMEPIQLAPDGCGFVLAGSKRPFVPWGHNYGPEGELLEDHWEKNWPLIEKDFRAIQGMGANVLRIHLQVGKFMEAADRPNAAAIKRLGKLLRLAEQTGIYLDLTGLACYRPSDTPAWYDALDEPRRWAAQARFWSAVAKRCSASPAVFCYDLINEPLSPGEKRGPGKYGSGSRFGGYDFLQFITLDPAGRKREEIPPDWIRMLTRAIRAKDRVHLITVGLLPWSQQWGHLSGFVPGKVAPELDFICVHIYPETAKPDEAMTCLQKFAVGKPVVIEETFPLSCSTAQLREFLLASRGLASGWIGHCGSKSLKDFEALQRAGKLTIADALGFEWLKLFVELRPAMMAPATQPCSRPTTSRGP